MVRPVDTRNSNGLRLANNGGLVRVATATGPAGPNTVPTDAAIAAAIETPASDTATALSAAYEARRSPLLGTKIVGGNIVPKPSGASWGGLFSEWDWNNWIKPQIDRAAVLGLNAVRLIGNPAIVHIEAGPGYPAITQTQYNERWLQLVDYCASLDLKVYPALCEKWAFYRPGSDDFDFEDPARIASIVSVAAALAGRGAVIGFDIFQEASGYTDGLTLSQVLAIYEEVRAVAPRVPVTTSLSSGNFGTLSDFWTDTTGLAAQLWAHEDGADFIDLHVYVTDPIADDLTYYTSTLRKPIVIGEFGSDQSMTATAQTRRYERVRRLHNRPGVTGSFVWGLADQSGNPADQAGVWDNTGFVQGSSALSTASGQRATLAAELSKFSQSPLAEDGRNLLDPVSQWMLNTSGWQEGTNASKGMGALGVDFFTAAAGSFVGGTAPTRKFPAAGLTAYRFELEVASSVAGRTLGARIDWYDASNAYITSSTAASGTSATTTPARMVGVVISPSTAAYGQLILTGTATGAGERHTVMRTPAPSVVAA